MAPPPSVGDDTNSLGRVEASRAGGGGEVAPALAPKAWIRDAQSVQNHRQHSRLSALFPSRLVATRSLSLAPVRPEMPAAFADGVF